LASILSAFKELLHEPVEVRLLRADAIAGGRAGVNIMSGWFKVEFH
jgi:hypothetical protein